MRRLLFPLLIIGVTVSLFSIGSGAFFSDSQTSTGNTFTADTFVLELEYGETLNGSFLVENVVPGESGTETFTLTNTSNTIDGTVDISGVLVTNTDAGEGSGSLGSRLNVTVTLGGTQIYTGPLDNFTDVDADVALTADNSINLAFAWNWPIGSTGSDAQDNPAQGDSVEVDFTVELDQIAD